MKKINILDIDVISEKRKNVLEDTKILLKGKDRNSIVKANSEFLVRSFCDKKFNEVLKTAGVVLADGIGVLWAARFLTLKTVKTPVLREIQILWQAKYSLLSLIFYPKFCKHPIPERIPGVEALYLMLEAAAKTSSSVYFFGAEEVILQKALKEIQKKMPDLKVVGSHSGYNYKDEEIINDINKSGAKLLIVALGSPKQEYWIRDNLSGLENMRIAVGEGGSLDFIAGASKRAPKWMQRIGLEWFWRLFMNKSKTSTGHRAKRIWNAVPVFVYTVIKYKIKNGYTEI